MTMSAREPGTVTVDEACAIVDASASVLRLAAERLPTARAVGRYLAEDQVSVLDLPPFDRSAMDGYAVRGDDERDEYRVVGMVAAGDPPGPELLPGTAVKIMTGAPVPPGAGRVVMVEHTEASRDTVRVTRHDGRANIALRGEDLHAGDPALPAGTHLGPAEIGGLVACGATEVAVFRRAQAFIISTGDELVQRAEDITPGRIMDSNGPMLVALCERNGLEVVGAALVPDGREATLGALRTAVDQADIVLASGGVSVGDYDYVLDAFGELGLAVRFARVAMRPGKPTVLAEGPDALVFGLPGNPVAVYVVFHLFVLRAVRVAVGAPPGPRTLRLPLAQPVRRRQAGRREFRPCRVGPEGTVRPADYHGSGHLMALSRADGVFVIPDDCLELEEGILVEFLPLGLGFG
jgi:molybdopterin molybdotransferase